MKIKYSPKNNPRVIIIQKLYGFLINNEEAIEFPKHRFKKFIKEVVNGSIERNELLEDELNKNLSINMKEKSFDKVFQIILKAATFEFLYKPNLSIKIIIKEYLNASNFFIEDSQTKYLNALLDTVGKNLRKLDERI
ncbi:transcription antitermination factor NusB [Candidatus Pelagibacter sp.]|uniref:transcription antitermination factor NusB n=1 Tax=Candidatus Pelagibacter sp. TaxID=2024849 RepID=UPI003F840708